MIEFTKSEYTMEDRRDSSEDTRPKLGRPKSILKQNSWDEKKTAPPAATTTTADKETNMAVAFDAIARNLETGETVPQSTKSRTEYLEEVRRRRGANLIDIFRAKEKAEREGAAKQDDGEIEVMFDDSA
ncbi:hypothetical protein F5Y04DRAFT_289189 [Hypomontagnella monticulosa]|nr:hypothetical protein F5Y04DRAFT_289189 [Hypomontagnella monticulosa]